MTSVYKVKEVWSGNAGEYVGDKAEQLCKLYKRLRVSYHPDVKIIQNTKVKRSENIESVKKRLGRLCVLQVQSQSSGRMH